MSFQQASELGHSLNENVLRPAQEKVRGQHLVPSDLLGVPPPHPETLIPWASGVGGVVRAWRPRAPKGPHPQAQRGLALYPAPQGWCPLLPGGCAPQPRALPQLPQLTSVVCGGGSDWARAALSGLGTRGSAILTRRSWVTETPRAGLCLGPLGCSTVCPLHPCTSPGVGGARAGGNLWGAAPRACQ